MQSSNDTNSMNFKILHYQKWGHLWSVYIAKSDILMTFFCSKFFVCKQSLASPQAKQIQAKCELKIVWYAESKM